MSGQAVLEGVMVRSSGSFAVAVRRESGEIVVRERPWRSFAHRWPILGLPMLRGVAALCEGVVAGSEGLAFAAEQAGLNGPLAPAAVDSIGSAGPARKPELTSLALSLALALGFGVGIFIALPHAMAVSLGRLVGGLDLQSWVFQAVAGGCKLLLFGVYLRLLAYLPDIRRLFMYHGAEHKVIAAYDAGDTLDVAHVRGHGMVRARCGTSFLLVLVVLAVMLFSVVFPWLPNLGQGWRSHLLAMAVKVPLMLPVAGLAYEFDRWAACRMHVRFVRWLVAPGICLQRLTVREPTDDMLEVALVALKAALSRGRPSVVETKRPSTLVYQNFADVCARQV